jgi:alpha-beta hydrolase superfamily lysophospholipase
VLEQLLAQKRGFMNKEVDELEDELRPEYDFAAMQEGVRGKYVQRYRAGTNLVRLDPDIAKAFPTEASVNEALRLLIQIADRQKLNSPVGAE